MAALAGVSKWTIYHWRDEAPDRLPPSMKIGGRVYFAAVQVTRWRPPPRESRRGKWPRQRVSVKDLAASAIERAKRNSIHK